MLKFFGQSRHSGRISNNLKIFSSEACAVSGPTRSFSQKAAVDRAIRSESRQRTRPRRDGGRRFDSVSDSARSDHWGGLRLPPERHRVTRENSQFSRRRDVGSNNVRSDSDDSTSPIYKGLRRGYHEPISIPLTTAASTFIAGVQPVSATLRSNRRKVYKLYIEYSAAETDEKSKSREKQTGHASIVRLCRALSVPTQRVSRDFINSALKKHTNNSSQIHDGVLLETSPLPQLPIHTLGSYSASSRTFQVELASQSNEEVQVNGNSDEVKCSSDGKRGPFLLWLHGVVDTRNAGALYRTALYFGADGIILTSYATTSVQAVDPKTSAGATEFTHTLLVSEPENFIPRSQAKGWLFYAAVAPSPKSSLSAGTEKQPLRLDEIRPHLVADQPTVLILGNETMGLPNRLIRRADELVTIPSYSGQALAAGVDSLNVSVAGALLCEKFLRMPRSISPQNEADALF